MNSIGHFWNLGFEPQNDFMEGVGEVLSPEEFKKAYGVDLQAVFGGHIIMPLQVRLETYKYVHLLCFMMHEYDLETREVFSVDPKMKNMGKYAVRITDVQSFVDILFEKLKLNSQYGLMGPMLYHKSSDKSLYRDCFVKNTNYAHENEWRFAVIPDYERAKELARKDPNGTVPYDEHVIYSVGDLTSIAEEIDVETLFKNPGKLYKDEKGYFKTVKKMTVSAETRRKQLEHIHDELGIGIPYQAYPWQYVGWAPREAFRNKVIELGGGIKPVITIGSDAVKSDENQSDDNYFQSTSFKYIYALNHLEGKERNKAINLTDEIYDNADMAKKWYRDTMKLIHPDSNQTLKNDAEKAVVVLNQIYKRIKKVFEPDESDMSNEDE